MKFSNIDEILDFAISNEETAFEFYLSLATKAKRPAMSEAFTEFAAEEEKHKVSLMAVKTGKTAETTIGGDTTDLNALRTSLESQIAAILGVAFT